ncbi:MAG: glycosyltransferase family 1 protein [bacterium]|nr:glycosyltransferase family 1 protein [bacterium]
MKIVLINDQPLYSGMGKYALKLYEGFKKTLPQKNHNIDFLFLDYNKRELQKEDGYPINKTYKIPIFDNKPYFWYRMSKKIPTNYDIFHFANQNLSFLIRVIKSRANKLTVPRYVVTCHDIAPLLMPSNLLEPHFRRYLYSGLKISQKIIVDSESTKNYLVKIFGIPANKIKVIYLGVDSDTFKPYEKSAVRKKLNLQFGLPLDKKLILNVGTEGRRKNISNLLVAFSLLNKKMPNTLLVRVGKKSWHTDRLIHKLKLTDKIKYFDAIPETELPIFYSAADLFVIPSYYEGFGLPALEAMSCDLPVVSSNTSSLPEVVGNAAITVNPKSPIELMNAMQRVLTNNRLYKELREKGIERTHKFSWAKTAAETVELYKKLLF